jgi:hypothetical protein
VSDVDPVRAYKAVIAELTAAAEALRDRDRARAAELTENLVDLEEARVRAEERAVQSRTAVEDRRQMVLDALCDEEWLPLKPYPRPDPDADPERLEALDREAGLAADAVIAAARHRFPFLR